MDSQAKSLNDRRVPAVAITSTSGDMERALMVRAKTTVLTLASTVGPQDLGGNKYRVGFLGPELAISSQFHEKVLNKKSFSDNIISLVIDEAHCVSEWGTEEFRPDFAKVPGVPSLF